MVPFAFIGRPSPPWMGDTTTTVTTTSSDAKPSAAPAPSGGGADMVSVVVIGGLILAGLEVAGVTHVTRWAKKTLGFSKR